MFSLPPKAAISAGAISLVAADLLSSVASSRPGVFRFSALISTRKTSVVHDRIANTDNREQPQLAAVAGKNDKVDQTVRERRPVTHTQQDTDRECQACKNRVDDIQDRRNEHEGELDRLGNTGQERGQRRGDHNTADFGTVFWFSRVPNRDSCSRQAVHFEQEAARQFTQQSGRLPCNEGCRHGTPDLQRWCIHQFASGKVRSRYGADQTVPGNAR